MLNKNLLVNLIGKMKNLSLSGDVEQIKVLSGITVSESENSIYIIGTGLDSEDMEIKDSFTIELSSINYIKNFCDTIEICTNNGSVVLIEEF